jgi:alkanesulfonate monooxygenase SsuD/methylene tetrahydromethanopterin reductase-like flavin-dependent oxidoreductase (luciferase family)
LSGLTTRARLGLLVTGLTYRHPSVFAAEVITIDHASGGRYELAYGAAWFDQEHRALAIPFPPTGERVSRFEEAVQIVKGLLTTDNFSFDGRYYQVKDATLRPRPVQTPHPPIWIGASGERMLGIAARHADVWHQFGTPESTAAPSAHLSELASAAGRDPGSILRAGSLSLEGDLDGVRRTIDAWRDAGFGYLVAGWPGTGRAQVEAFAAAALPA